MLSDLKEGLSWKNNVHIGIFATIDTQIKRGTGTIYPTYNPNGLYPNHVEYT